MWPLDRRWPRDWFSASAQDVVGIGRAGLERWRRTGASCTLVDDMAFSADTHPVSGLAEPLTRFLEGTGPRGRITLVLESAWLPLVLVDTGGQLLQHRALEAMVRHRLSLVHAENGGAAHWHIRVDHRPGDRYALGYGMEPALADLLMAGSRAKPWRAVLPAFAWGRARWAALGQRSSLTGWWAWTEQDRTILSCWDTGRLSALHPALPRTLDRAGLLRWATIEASRWGLLPGQAMEVSDWHTALGARVGEGPVPGSAWWPMHAAPGRTP